MGKSVRQLRQMKSNLSKTEFKGRLQELTSSERTFFFLPPFNFSRTPFCGTFDDSKFDLTRNSFWTHVKGIEIKGEYLQADEKTTEVSYTIGISKFIKLFSWIILGLTIIGSNTILLVFSAETPTSVYLTVNGFFVFGYLWFRAVNWITTKIVNQRFQLEFEIGIEDEWERLANSTRKVRVNS